MTKIHLLLVEDNWQIRTHLVGSLAKTENVRALHSIANKLDIVEFISLDVERPSEDVANIYRIIHGNLPPINPLEVDTPQITAADGDKTTPRIECIKEGASQGHSLTDFVGQTHSAMPKDLVEVDGRVMLNSTPDGAWQFCGHTFYPSRRYVLSPAGTRTSLTCAEVDLLTVLCRNAGRVVSREQLISLIHGTGVNIPKRSIDILISRLRRKLSIEDPLADFIRTIRAGGYIFKPKVECRWT